MATKKIFRCLDATSNLPDAELKVNAKKQITENYSQDVTLENTKSDSAG